MLDYTDARADPDCEALEAVITPDQYEGDRDDYVEAFCDQPPVDESRVDASSIRRVAGEGNERVVVQAAGVTFNCYKIDGEWKVDPHSEERRR